MRLLRRRRSDRAADPHGPASPACRKSLSGSGGPQGRNSYRVTSRFYMEGTRQEPPAARTGRPPIEGLGVR